MKDEALKQALEALEFQGGYEAFVKVHESAATAIKQALAAPVQEPYGQVTVVRNPGCAEQHWFYRWPEPPYLDNAAECHTVYTTPPAAPVQDGMVLVPKRMTKAMQEVADTEGWQWEDLLAAAEAITEDEYNEIATSPSAQPAMPLTNEDLDRCRQWFDSIQDTNP